MNAIELRLRALIKANSLEPIEWYRRKMSLKFHVDIPISYIQRIVREESQ